MLVAPRAKGEEANVEEANGADLNTLALYNALRGIVVLVGEMLSIVHRKLVLAFDDRMGAAAAQFEACPRALDDDSLAMDEGYGEMSLEQRAT
jgi:hypothetical protein